MIQHFCLEVNVMENDFHASYFKELLTTRDGVVAISKFLNTIYFENQM